MATTLEEVAADLGFEFIGQPGAQVRVGLEQLYGSEKGWRIDDVIERRFDGGRLVVANIKSQTSYVGRETVLYFSERELRLPTLMLLPAGLVSPIGCAGQTLLGWAGTKLAFDDDPEF